MNINILIVIIMMISIIIVVTKNLCHPGFAMIIIPIAAAVLMGYSPSEIEAFISDGIQKVVGVLVMVLLAIVYFGVLHERGIFKAIVKFIIRYTKGHTLFVIFSTAVISFLTQLDGSGATTALCTIPPLKPVYEKMNIRKTTLVLIEGLASGTLVMIPWAGSLCEACAYADVDVYETFLWLLPAMLFGIVLVFVYCFFLYLYEKKRGAGISEKDLETLNEELEKQQLKCSKPILYFDLIFTALLLALILSGVISPLLAFAVGSVVLIFINYGSEKAQTDYIKSQGGHIINLTISMIGVGVLLGVNDGTGAMRELAEYLIHTNSEVIPHIPAIASFLSIILTMIMANAKLAVIMPLIAAAALPFGFDKIQVIGAIFSAGCVGTCINLFNPSAYLTLSLADVDMKDNLKANFIPVYIFSIMITMFNIVTGRLPL